MLADRLIFSEVWREAIAADPLVLVDAGARGSLEEPWASLDAEVLQAIGFEPDEQECRRLNERARPGERYLPTALWSEAGAVDIHVADVPSCSSVHPPNFELLRAYRDEHWKPRETQAVSQYPATTLDAALAGEGLRCDFLKIDTQGAEFEILSGAAESLDRDVFGVVVETWTEEVHAGQRLSGDVMTLMAKHGFALYDLGVGAAWHRAGDLENGKRQIIGLDLLFLRRRAAWPEEQPVAKLLKAAAIADLYGFTGYALGILTDAEALEDGGPAAELSSQLREAAVRRQETPGGWRRLLRRARPGSTDQEFASLHQ